MWPWANHGNIRILGLSLSSSDSIMKKEIVMTQFIPSLASFNFFNGTQRFVLQDLFLIMCR